MITAIAITAGVVLLLAGLATTGWLINGGSGAHKKPAFAGRDPGAVTPPAGPAPGRRRRPVVTRSAPPWAEATPPEVTAAVDLAPEITQVIGWRPVDDVVDSLFTKAMARTVAEAE